MDGIRAVKEGTAGIVRRPLYCNQLRRTFEILSYGAAAAAIGYGAWSFTSTAVVLSLLLPVLWSKAHSRSVAFSATLGYYLAVLSGQYFGGVVFFSRLEHPTLAALAIWLCSSASLSLIWAVCWSPSPAAWRTITAVLLTSLPPLGLLMGWASPIASAGILFPGTSILGLVLVIVVLGGISSTAGFAKLLVPLGSIALLLNIVWTPPGIPTSVIGVDTRFGGVDGGFKHLQILRYLDHWRFDAPLTRHTLYVFPELVADDWAVDQRYLTSLSLKLAEARSAALIGTRIFDADGKYQNGLMAIGAADAQSLTAVIPAPIAHWRPWNSDSARPGLLNQSLLFNGTRVAAIICYEQTLFWYTAMVLISAPDVVIAPANIWWAKNSNIARAQRNTVEAAARLFSIPVVFAINE